MQMLLALNHSSCMASRPGVAWHRKHRGWNLLTWEVVCWDKRWNQLNLRCLLQGIQPHWTQLHDLLIQVLIEVERKTQILKHSCAKRRVIQVLREGFENWFPFPELYWAVWLYKPEGWWSQTSSRSGALYALYEVYQLCPVFTTSEILVIICYYALRLSWLQFSPLGKAKNQTVEDCFKLMQVQANVKMDDDDSDPLPHLGTNMCAAV